MYLVIFKSSPRGSHEYFINIDCPERLVVINCQKRGWITNSYSRDYQDEKFLSLLIAEICISTVKTETILTVYKETLTNN